MKKKIVILGGGTGGLVAANILCKGLAKDNEIILIDKEKNHLFNPSLLWFMIGLREKKQIEKPLALLKNKGIKFINDTILKMDFEKRMVLTGSQEINFDYLIISPGASIYPDKIPGFVDSAYNLYDLNGVEKLKNELGKFNNGRLVVLITSLPFKCPAAPYEAAIILSSYFKKKGKNVSIEIITPENLPMPTAGPEVGNMLVELLKSRGIKFLPGYETSKIDSSKKEIIFKNGNTASYDFLIGIPAHGLPQFLIGSPILGKSGWVKVNSKTLETDIENIYAIGDVTGIPLPSGRPLPKAGVFAHYQAEVVSHNIIAKINGISSKKEFDGRGYCFIEMGDGIAGYASGNFYADPKPLVNIKKPSGIWHIGKVLFEKWWLWKWF
ncbi:NAD(P)/FAD-dependent oxidoreductase [Candidatus Poribacteria bacterium]|nr:NAD(P)/FAD-dependent oxidoreductase [Candidatus Poribacteria bacterium]